MSRLGKRPQVDHTEVADRLRATPHTWMPVGDYNSRESARTLAWKIRGARTKGLISPYDPAGAFETRTQLTEDGARLEARYIGVKGGTT